MLCKGPKFCPSTKGNYIHTRVENKELSRKLKLHEHFWSTEYKDESLVRHPSQFNPKCDNIELNRVLTIIDCIDPAHTLKSLDNLSTSERNAIAEIKELCKTDLEIKKADKGSAFVIMDKDYYRDKLVLNDHLQSDTYKEVDANSDEKVMKDLKELIRKHEKCLTEKEKKYITDFDWKSSNLYVQPKIHKSKEIIDAMKCSNSLYIHLKTPEDLKGRAIVGGPQSPTQHLSELLEKLLSPLVPHLKSYVKDDWHFLRKFPRQLDPNCKLYSCDVVNLYTNISHDLGLKALRYWIDRMRHLIPDRFTTLFILEAAAFVLEHNNFCFDKRMFVQLIGTAIGTKFAPPYACLAMGFLEETKLYPHLKRTLEPDLYEFLLNLFLRYMDDGIVALPPSIDIKFFEDSLQSMDPNISFTLEEATVSVNDIGGKSQVLNYLDVNVIMQKDGMVETDVYYKETNSHDYLDFFSHHPNHTKENIPYNLAKRILVFCSNEETEKLRLKELKQWLINCNYPEQLIDRKFHCARLQGPANKSEGHVFPIVSTYYSNYDVDNISKTANSLLSNLKSNHLQTVFEDCKIISSYRQPPNLLLQLTNSSFESAPEAIVAKKPGLYKCNSNRCELCKLKYIQECTSFNTSNGYKWTIKSHINCNSQNVLYFLKCTSCEKVTYTGKTNNLRLRMNNHRSSAQSGKGTDIFDNHVFECRQRLKVDTQPLFLVYCFMTVKNSRLLLSYESYLHSKNFDTMNC